MTNHSHEVARRETTRKAIQRVLELAGGHARNEVDLEAIAHVRNIYGIEAGQHVMNLYRIETGQQPAWSWITCWREAGSINYGIV